MFKCHEITLVHGSVLHADSDMSFFCLKGYITKVVLFYHLFIYAPKASECGGGWPGLVQALDSVSLIKGSGV